MEGGGNTSNSRAAIRQGMDAFVRDIKDAARAKRMRWKLVACGGRQSAFDAFRGAPHDPDYQTRVLLVDAESPLLGSPCLHLNARDGWNLDPQRDLVHLMVQTMEAWIVADVDALAAYYGQHFNKNALPVHNNLEEVAKSDVGNALDEATRNTRKGAYHKIRHAGDLLARINSGLTRTRCPNCERMFVELGTLIQRAC
jgi:hypothetical protein